ncbi:hypothetical protein B0H11DRAFT_1965717 [Mycena galericulata]|nr:hypothetical protein B0H11DRAFT_1965717 [Mycena galericulata]
MCTVSSPFLHDGDVVPWASFQPAQRRSCRPKVLRELPLADWSTGPSGRSRPQKTHRYYIWSVTSQPSTVVKGFLINLLNLQLPMSICISIASKQKNPYSPVRRGCSISRSNNDPPIEKISFLPSPATITRGDPSWVTLNSRPNVVNDLELDIHFQSRKYAEQFTAMVAENQARQPPSLETTVYILQPTSNALRPAAEPSSLSDQPEVRVAHLFKGSPLLHECIDSVFTALAYTDSADILGPVVEWDIRKDIPSQQRSHRINQVQSRFKNEPPPPILILDGAASQTSSPLPSIMLWDNTKSSPFVTNRHLPSPPTWPGPDSAPNDWLNFSVKNYGVHTRNVDTTRPRYIALSHELVDHFHAACEAYEDENKNEEEQLAARESLDAAIGSLKGTVVHELAHLWVTETIGESPPRDQVKGAGHPFYDIIEDQHNSGNVEAGCLVETAWLGRWPELAFDQSGWLKLAIRQHEDEVGNLGSGTEHQGPVSQLGSPIHLSSDRSVSTSHTSYYTQGSEIDPVVSVRRCDKDAVAKFREPGLPLFPRGLIEDDQRATPQSQRHRDGLFPSTPSPRRNRGPQRSCNPPTPQQERGFLCGSSAAVPGVFQSMGTPWPKVVQRK